MDKKEFGRQVKKADIVINNLISEKSIVKLSEQEKTKFVDFYKKQANLSTIAADLLYNISTEKSSKEFHKLTKEDIQKRLEKNIIPFSIFNSKKLSTLEIVVKYLKENKSLSYHQIALILKRNDRTIWTTYQKASKKYKEKFSKLEGIEIPVEIFSNRKLSPLESLVHYLKDSLQISLSSIASQLSLSNSTIWTVYSRIKKKL